MTNKAIFNRLYKAYGKLYLSRSQAQLECGGFLPGEFSGMNEIPLGDVVSYLMSHKKERLNKSKAEIIKEFNHALDKVWFKLGYKEIKSR